MGRFHDYKGKLTVIKRKYRRIYKTSIKSLGVRFVKKVSFLSGVTRVLKYRENSMLACLPLIPRMNLDKPLQAS